MHHVPYGALAAALALLTGAAAAQVTDCPDPRVRTADGCVTRAAAAEGAKAIAEAVQTEFGLSASILRISIGGAAILTEAWGETLTGVPATPDMHFRNGAIAIPYMSVVALRLQEEGALDLDGPIAKWLPDMPNADRVTPAMLVTNTSGYPDYVDLDVLPLFDDVFRQWTSRELTDIAFSKPSPCEPGACFTYAHTNYVVLGQVLSAASGRPMAALIEDYVLAPAGLRNTRSSGAAAIPAPVLHAYTAERGAFEASTDWSPSWTLAEGAIMTTDIYDAERSAIAIGAGELVSEADFARMTAPLPDGLGQLPNGAYYAFGLAVDKGWLMQAPSFFGYFGMMAYHPATRIAVAYAATSGPTSPDRPNIALIQRLQAYLTPAAAP